MGLEEVASVSTGMVLEVGRMANWLKAAGIAALIWIIFESIALWFNYRRLKELAKIMGDVRRIEGKLDRALKKS